ncbi:MAG: TlpA disulfide reductase family protein [Planctomycetota bacterium]
MDRRTNWKKTSGDICDCLPIQSTRVRTCCLAVLATLSLVLMGCGGGETSSDNEVVTPESTNSDLVGDIPAAATIPSGTNEDTPAGSMLLPPGEIPKTSAGTDETSSGNKGMSLPADFDPSSQGASIDLRISPWDDVQQLATSSGKITVLDLWSLACGPCLQEYPNLVRLQNAYPNRIKAIGANLDFDGRKTRPPESYESRVRAFLASVNAEFLNVIVSTPSDDVFTAAGIASIPSVMIFDASGKMVRQFVDAGETAGFTYEADIIPLVETLL